MTSLLARSYLRVDGRPFHADVGVRLLAGDTVTDVLISTKERRILLATMEPEVVEIVLFDRFASILDLVGKVLPKNQAIRVASQEQEGLPGVGSGTPFWPDCVPGPAEGEFVFYEEAPVPVNTPAPQLSTEPKPGDVVHVILHAYVDSSGRVCFAKVIRGSEPFASAAVDAARRWVFKPALNGGKPLGVWVELPFDFKP